MFVCVQLLDQVVVLAVGSSAGVAPEVNLKNALHADDEAHKGSTNRADVTRSTKQEYQWPTKEN